MINLIITSQNADKMFLVFVEYGETERCCWLSELENGMKIILSRIELPRCKDAPCFSCVKRELLTFKRRKGLPWNLLALLGRVIEN